MPPKLAGCETLLETRLTGARSSVELRCPEELFRGGLPVVLLAGARSSEALRWPLVDDLDCFAALSRSSEYDDIIRTPSA
jgi:hypothetical protein